MFSCSAFAAATSAACGSSRAHPDSSSAQPFGPGLFLRDAALFVVHLE